MKPHSKLKRDDETQEEWDAACKKACLIHDLEMLKELLEQGWCQGTMARDEGGRGVLPQSREACEFCILGGIERVTWGIEQDDLDRGAALTAAIVGALPVSVGGEGKGSILYFNEHETRKHEDVLALVDRAMEAAQ